MALKVVCISDTHGVRVSKLPQGDVLIHAGDISSRGSMTEMTRALALLKQQALNFKHIIYVPGNHDFLAETNESLLKEMCNEHQITYLHDNFTIIDGYKFYGSGWTPEFFEWALMLPRGEKLALKWDMIPIDTDVLITHGPPNGIMDECSDLYDRKKRVNVGCEALIKRVLDIQPKYHIFGHIHEHHGIQKGLMTTFINAAILGDNYREKFKPIEFVLDCVPKATQNK